MQNAECKITGEAKLPNIINDVFKTESNDFNYKQVANYRLQVAF